MPVHKFSGTDWNARPKKGTQVCEKNSTRTRTQINQQSIGSGSRATWVPEWSDWFEGLTITLEEDGTTLLSGPITDQAALHGLLKKVRDMGLPLLAVCPHEPGQADVSDVK